MPLFADDNLIAGLNRAGDAVCEDMHQAGATRTKNDSAKTFAVHESIHEAMGPFNGGGRAIARGIARAKLNVVVQKMIANRVGDVPRNLGAAGVL